jgi:hypothetical protein
MASDFSTGWHTMAKAVRDLDEYKVRDVKEDIDTLLVFVRHDSLSSSQPRLMNSLGWVIFRSSYCIRYRVLSASAAG